MKEGVFYVGGTLHKGVSCKGGEFFIESDPDLATLFEK